MKKIISLLSILLVVFLLCACGDTTVPSTSSTEESQQSTTQSSVIDTNDKDTEEGTVAHELSLTTDFVMDEFYPMIDCGRFEAADFARIALNTYEYRIIDTHEELIAKTTGGAGYSSTIFESISPRDSPYARHTAKSVRVTLLLTGDSNSPDISTVSNKAIITPFFAKISIFVDI